MTLVNAQPVRFSPAGLSDSLDETDLFPGACFALQNLVPDPSTRNIWACRPASTQIIGFGSFSSGFSTGFDVGSLYAGAVSVFKVVGSLIYGMIGSPLYPGKDAPFCFNIVTGFFIGVSGVTSANLPLTQPTTGDWTPPTMDTVGVNLVVTHPGFDGATYFFGWLDISNPALPRWHAGNLAGVGSINVLGTVTGGSGYVNGFYTEVPLTGGSGSGATADITVAGGQVISVAVDSWGVGYAAADNLSATAGNIGGSGSGFSVVVTSVYTGNLQLTTRPSWIAQFNGRGWFGLNPASGQPSTPFTDSLVLAITDATHVLTYDDNTPLTAGHGLPLNNQFVGGIVQSLLVFKGATTIYQVTGDSTTNNLAKNALNVATGTLSPRTICNTPVGVAFLAPDGLRIIDFQANIGDVIGAGGEGVQVPFISPVAPTRACAGSNAAVIRITIENSQVPATPVQEYWYHLTYKRWSGPHTFPATMVDVYAGQFILAAYDVEAALWQSSIFPSPTTTYTENGVPLQWVFQSAMMADNMQMAQSEITEMQVKAAAGAGTPGMQVSILDQDGNVYNTLFYAFAASLSLWDQAIWDQNVWGGNFGALSARRISWDSPVIYNRAAVRISGASERSFRLGDTFIRRRVLGYMQVGT